MKAVYIEDFGGVEKLKIGDLAISPPQSNEVQIKILYTAVNPVDWKIREGLLQNRMPHEFPIILGWDAAGKVAAVGQNVKNFKIDDEVYAYCRKPTIQWGTYTEFINVDVGYVALKPKKINFAEAAAIPLAGLTAWQSLFDCAKLKKGESILIHAGAGGVGSLAIQFAKNIGAIVYTTSSQQNFSYVKKLGATEAIDYKAENFVEKMKSLQPNGIDVVFDTVGGHVLHESVQVLKPGGRIVSILEKLSKDITDRYQIQANYVFVTPNGEELKKIADLIDQAKICPPKIEEMPLKDVGVAQEKLRKGMGGGKIVLKVA